MLFLLGIRSHLDTIYDIAIDPQRDEFATVSRDGTIRIWGLHSLEQIYEFYSPNECATCVAYHPIASEYRLACGFASGSMRVMDIATTTMHKDYQQHQGKVVDILFSHDAQYVYTGGEDGNICAYSVAQNYLPVRMFTTYRVAQPFAILPTLPPGVTMKKYQQQMEQKKKNKELALQQQQQKNNNNKDGNDNKSNNNNNNNKDGDDELRVPIINSYTQANIAKELDIAPHALAINSNSHINNNNNTHTHIRSRSFSAFFIFLSISFYSLSLVLFFFSPSFSFILLFFFFLFVCLRV